MPDQVYDFSDWWHEREEAAGIRGDHEEGPGWRSRSKRNTNGDARDDMADAAHSDALPHIDAGNRDLAASAQATWSALRAANQPVWLCTHGNIPVRIERDDDGVAVARPLNVDRLRGVAARAARFFIVDKEGRRRNAYPPIDVIRDMVVEDAPPLPPLVRITAAPTFAADGSIETAAGYCPKNKTYYAPRDGLQVPPVPQEPTTAEIERARDLITGELIGDFPFVDDAARAHAVALTLLPFMRDLIDGPTPLHLIEKPMAGTGAGLLADAVLSPAVGQSLAVMTEGRDDDEWRKRLTATLTSAPSVVLIDNLRGRLDSGQLAAALTTNLWTDRILGTSQVAHLRIRCVWIATGNNPQLSDEMARRSVSIRLDARTDRPWLRSGFRHPNLRGWASTHRGELVWAALTLGRAWIAAGRPAGTATLGSYESWAATMGGILGTIGVPGFLANINELYDAADAEGAAWRAFTGAWWDDHGTAEVGVSDLWRLVTGSGDINIDLGRGGDRSQRTKLGLLLARRRDVQFGELRIRAAGVRQRAQMWRLESCQ